MAQEKELLISMLECLPQEIVLEILSRLPITSLLQMMFVCRTWHSITQDPHLVATHFSHSTKIDPCLILHSDFPLKNQLFLADIPALNIHNGMVKKISVPAMSKFNVVGSCNGLLCLIDSGLALYIYNPFTRTCKKMPETTLRVNHIFGFGFHPTTEQYKIVAIVTTFSSASGKLISCGSDVKILTLGSTTWRRLEIIPFYITRPTSFVLIKGRLHWIAWPCGYSPSILIVSFDIGDEQFREVARPPCGGLDNCRYQLVALAGCLSAVEYCDDRKLKIWTMKVYDVKESWMMEFSIGAYLPKGLEVDVGSSFRASKLYRHRFRVQVLCVLRNGKVLLEYKCRALVFYDPKDQTFTDVMFVGMPNWFETIVHVGSLNRIDTSINV